MSTSTTFTRSARAAVVAKASLNVIGDAGVNLPSPISVLGTRPDSFYRIGESRHGERPSPRDAWFLTESQTVGETEDFAEAVRTCLERLLRRLQRLDAGSRLRSAGLIGKASITVHGVCRELSDANLSFSESVLRDLAEMGVPLDEDFNSAQ